jgi:hypothetical protein
MIHVACIRDIEEVFEVAASCNTPCGGKILIEFPKNQFHVSISTIHVSKEAAGGDEDF